MVVSSILLPIASLIFAAIAIVLAIPIAVLWVECFAALLYRRPPAPTLAVPPLPAPKTVVLMPAHNEAAIIQTTIDHLRPQLNASTRLVVVADNCTDETAMIARSAGAIIAERHNAEQRGKGYALDYGLSVLESDPPDVVIVVDADCLVQPDGISELARQSVLHQRPIQAVYLMEQPAEPKPKDSVSAFAFKVKNLVRPLGLAKLGYPCLLTGTGMAFPWKIIRATSLASDNIVEDMQLGIDLTIAGSPPRLCEHIEVIGLLPQQRTAALSQRTRWEHGHLQTLLTQAAPLLWFGLRKMRPDLLSLALEISVPPLTLLVLLWMATFLGTLVVELLGGGWIATTIAAIEGVLLFSAILSAWLRFGRSDLPASTLLAVPLYVLWKIPLYLKFLLRPQTKWVRTERDRPDASNR